MGRQKSVAQLQKELEYARKRAAYNPPVREEGGVSTRRPKVAYAYKPMQLPGGQGSKKYKVQASKESVQFFGASNLNLTDAAAEEQLARGAQPAKVHAMVADSTPKLVRAKGSTRPYIRYGKGTRESGSQYTYTAPISIQSASALDAEVKTAFNAVKGKLGGPYGRVWFTPEYFVLADGGE